MESIPKGGLKVMRSGFGGEVKAMKNMGSFML